MMRLEELLKKLRKNELINRFISDYGGQLKKIAVISILIVLAFLVFVIKGNDDGIAVSEQGDTGNKAEKPISTIFVDIGGAVNSPMLAELPEGSRVEDAILAAGGLTDDADLSSINRAEFLEDGEKIYIPVYINSEDGTNLDENSVAAFTSGASSGTIASGKVNINTADSTSLQTLNGVGPATAQKIIDYRTANGRFKDIKDITNVSGIGDKTFEKLKDFITT